MSKTSGNSKKPMTKSEIMETLATETDLTKKEVARILEELAKLIDKNIGKRGPGVFNVPGLLKVMVVRKPATEARKGINPFTGQETMFKAKPARNVVKIRPLKGLKDMV
ncbi:MAG TPA: HU family DNA-binding protein [Planctomycetaceae bacterium]|jgi:nucleoid DNA-binding protein|nr:HU family DNA-binding protein [Planctomycetaceae bacterium]